MLMLIQQNQESAVYLVICPSFISGEWTDRSQYETKVHCVHLAA